LAALNDYDGFDYAQNAIHTLSGGSGWNGAYNDTDGDYSNSLTNDGVSLNTASFPFAASVVGSRMKVAAGEVIRPVSPASSIAMNADGNTLYVSFLMKKINMDHASGDYMEVDITTSNQTTRQLRMGISDDDQFYIGNNTTQYAMKAGAAVLNETYFVVGKMLSRASSPDELFMNVYGPGDAVPLTEPSTWLLSATATYNAVPINVRIETGGGTTAPVFAEFDELRIGTTWAGVAVPEPAGVALVGLGGLLLARRRRG
jgi:hypothetical protein